MEHIEDIEKIGSEVYAILKEIPEEKYKKIPKDERAIYEKFKETAKKINIDPNKELCEQNISNETMDIISSIAFRFWLSEDEKNTVLNAMKENEKKINELKHSEKDIFKDSELKCDNSKNIAKEENNKMPIKVHKKNFIESIFDAIRKIFFKSKK